MVASSEQQSAPVMVSKPAMAHASSNQPGAPLNRADWDKVMKMPEPIIEPITIMVASTGPSARTRSLVRSLLFIPRIAARGLLPLLFRGVSAKRAQIQPRPVYRRASKLFLAEHRHLLHRP